MKFQAPFALLLTTFIGYVCSETSGPALETRVHSRDFAVGSNVHIDTDLDLSKRAPPALDASKDPDKLHVWVRTDTRRIQYDERQGGVHKGLNTILCEMQGRHKDVVIGHGREFYEYGLWIDPDWLTRNNGDGSGIEGDGQEYEEIKDKQGHVAERYRYVGQVKDGRKTLKSIVLMARNFIPPHQKYNHKTYNCETYAEDFAKLLVN